MQLVGNKTRKWKEKKEEERRKWAKECTKITERKHSMFEKVQALRKKTSDIGSSEQVSEGMEQDY